MRILQGVIVSVAVASACTPSGSQVAPPIAVVATNAPDAGNDVDADPPLPTPQQNCARLQQLADAEKTKFTVASAKCVANMSEISARDPKAYLCLSRVIAKVGGLDTAFLAISVCDQNNPAKIGAPRLIAPATGALVHTSKPSFTLDLANQTDGAEIEVCSDRACEKSVTRFAAKERAEPPQALPVGRLFYRARSKRGSVLGTRWSPVWQIEVAPGTTNADTSAITFADPTADELTKRFARGALTGAGDINGDGYSDALAVRCPIDAPACKDPVLTFFSGAPDAPELRVEWPAAATTQANWIELGDVNRDGFADVVLTTRDGAWLFAGSEEGPGRSFAVSPAWTMGSRGRQGFDFNGDGFMDYAAIASSSANAVKIHFGSPAGLGKDPALELNADAKQTGGFGDSLAFGDVNGDGFADIIIGDYYGGPKRRGRVHVFFGGKTPSKTAAVIIDEQEPDKASKAPARFGFSVRVRDADGDGIDDIFATMSCYVGEKENGSCKGPFEYLFKGARDGLKIDKPIVTKLK